VRRNAFGRQLDSFETELKLIKFYPKLSNITVIFSPSASTGLPTEMID
jgi:glutamine amidotransferase PdxT